MAYPNPNQYMQQSLGNGPPNNSFIPTRSNGMFMELFKGLICFWWISLHVVDVQFLPTVWMYMCNFWPLHCNIAICQNTEQSANHTVL